MLYDSSLPFDFSDFFCFAEKICLVDGKQSIAATILHELDSMTPDAFQAELRAPLISFYEGILKVPSVSSRRRRGRLSGADPGPPAAGEAAAAEAAPPAKNSPPGKGTGTGRVRDRKSVV